MHIVVCVKQILDPEIPPREFRLDPQTGHPVQGVAPLVMDNYATNALETAIQLRDKTPGAKVTAICLGDKPADDTLRRALSFTADAAVRVWDPAWQALDGMAVAHALACAIKVLGGADLVLTGRQAGDVEEGLVGPALADELGIPCVNLVASVELTASGARATREAEGGFAVVDVPLPAVLTVTSAEGNVPRLPKVKDVMMSKGKPVKVLGAADLGADPSSLAAGVRLERAYVPQTDVQCDLLVADDGPGQADLLARRLQELKLV